ncbi:adenylate kinase [Candidatus Bathyarchaeota archaeon]|nr:adenylate kinase [Candidatus Bathyarchaeota archaeon]
MRIVILGPPGSGKGTRARIISDMYSVPVITTGDMLREATALGTRLGTVAKGYMDRGELVPDDIVNRIVAERLRKPDLEKGFILDGYPSSVAQADALDKILEEAGLKLDHVMVVDIKDETIISRLSLRRSCPKCGEIYHLESKPPKRNKTCDKCGSKLIQRSDDKEDVVRHRLVVYREKTQPLIDRYQKRGLIRVADGDRPMDAIPEEVRRLLG